MVYKLFISHTSEDMIIAQTVQKIVNDAFQGYIELYMAAEEVLGGRRWQEELIRNIEESNGIISIFTPNSVNKPWLYIEWAPFWIQNKKTYTLLTSEIKVTELVQPMQESQTTDMVNIDSVKRFFCALRDDADIQFRVPYRQATVFVAEIFDAQHAQRMESFEIYRHNLSGLPADDDEKRIIADHFYRIKDYITFQRIVKSMMSDTMKSNIGLQALCEGNLYATNLVLETMNSAEHLGYMALELLKRGLSDTNCLRVLLEDLHIKNHAELRKVAMYLINVGQEDTDLFRYTCDLITNMAEMRKVAVCLIENNKIDSDAFQETIDRFKNTNRAELRKVAMEFIRHNISHTRQFNYIMDILFTKSSSHALQVMEELNRSDRELFDDILSGLQEKDLIVDIDVLNLLIDMQKNRL